MAGGGLGGVLLYGRTGALSLETAYARAFDSVGLQASIYEADPAAADLSRWIRSRVGRRLARTSLRLRRLAVRRRNAALLKQAVDQRPRLALLVNGALVMPETVAALRELGAVVAILHPDAPVPGNSNFRPEHLPSAREADFCFIWSRRLVDSLLAAGARRVEYLPFAWDPKQFPYVPHPGDGGKVVFVGGWDRHRERLLEPVAEHFDLEIWGPAYWGTRTRFRSPLRRCWMGRAVRGQEAAEVVAHAAIALNVLREQNLPDGTNMRTFEVPGAGGFLLANRTVGATEIYAEGRAGAFFGSEAELLEKIRYYLGHPRERRQIARRAHEITEQGQRYVHRARRILEIARALA